MKLRRQLRETFVVDGVVTLVLFVIAILSVSFVLDYFMRLPWGVRCIFLLGVIVLLVREISRKVYEPLAVRLPDEELAVLVERSHKRRVESNDQGRDTRAISPDCLCVMRIKSFLDSRISRLQRV